MKISAKKESLTNGGADDLAANAFDLVIMGGGLAGLSLGIQIKNRIPSISIAILEKSSFPVAEAAHKVGEATVELSTYYLSQVLGQLEHLENDQLPKLGLRYYFNVNEQSPHDIDSKLEFGTRLFPKTPSFQLDRGILENHLKEVCDSLGITVLDNTKVKGAAVGEDGAEHVVEYMAKDDQSVARLSCKWLVDASSRASILKRELGLLEDSPHQASSAWFRISEKISVNDWYETAEWGAYHTEENTRWYSTNHFMGTGYWVWFIPLASGATSIGIVTDNNYHGLNEYNNIEKAIAWLEKYEPLCAAKVIPHLDKVLDFRAVKNFSHSAAQVYSSNRWYLTGEAGVFLDPFYSPGSDYIAMSNTLITNIIEKDYMGENVDALTRKSNHLYLGIFESTVRLYHDTYQVFGKPTIMFVKYLWDTTLYWGVNTLLFMQNKFNNQAELHAYYMSVADVVELNKNIQQLFIAWSKLPQQDCVPGYVDISSKKFDFFIDMNRVLTRDLNKEEFDNQLKMSAEKIRTLYCDVIDMVGDIHPELAGKYPKPQTGLYKESSPIRYVMDLVTGKIPMSDQYAMGNPMVSDAMGMENSMEKIVEKNAMESVEEGVTERVEEATA